MESYEIDTNNNTDGQHYNFEEHEAMHDNTTTKCGSSISSKLEDGSKFGINIDVANATKVEEIEKCESIRYPHFKLKRRPTESRAIFLTPARRIRTMSLRPLHQFPTSMRREFPLDSSTATSSSFLHDSCSSLKDQFLKIKERFSNPAHACSVEQATLESPAYTNDTMCSPQNNPDSILGHVAMQTVSEGRIENSRGPEADTNELNKHKNSEQISTNSREEADIIEDVSAASSSGHFCMGNIDGINAANPHSYQRWQLIQNCYKATFTCWTMEDGAEVMNRIVEIVKENVTDVQLQPDVSLQWIGCDRWAVIVSLPINHLQDGESGHTKLAQDIDDAFGIHDNEVLPIISSRHGRILPRNASSLATVPLVHRRSVSFDSWSQSRQTNLIQSIQPNQIRPKKEQPACISTISLQPQQRKTSLASLTATASSITDEIDTAVAGNVDLPFSWSMLSLSSVPSASDSGSIGLSNDNFLDTDEQGKPYTPQKTGWLKKKAGMNSWQPRYFELKGNRLYYFATDTDGLPRGAIIMDNAHAVRGKGESSHCLSITPSSSLHPIQMIKFTGRMTHQLHQRKCCVLRVMQDPSGTEDKDLDTLVTDWITILNRASFYGNTDSHSPRDGNIPLFRSPCKVTTPSTYAPSSLNILNDIEVPQSILNKLPSKLLNPLTPGKDQKRIIHSIDSHTIYPIGSVRYLQETDPLLWTIHPPDQIAIRKRASTAKCKADFLSIFSKYQSTFCQIFLPRPHPISLEQTLRDILPELFLINNVLYGTGNIQQSSQSTHEHHEETMTYNGLENIFEVLDGLIKKFASDSSQQERVRFISCLLQACARTICGGDSYFVVHSLLGNPLLIIRPAEARGHPIEIEVSPTNPAHFCITVFSAFSFHLIEDIEKYADISYLPNTIDEHENGIKQGSNVSFDQHCETIENDSRGISSSTGGSPTPEPMMRVQTYHVQEFDFLTGKSTRWLRIRTDGMKEESNIRRSSSSWANKHRDAGVQNGFGHLLDALA